MCVGDYGLLPCRSNRQRYRRREVECIEAGSLKSEEITEKMISDHLMTKNFGPYQNPDLLIRTSGGLFMVGFGHDETRRI